MVRLFLASHSWRLSLDEFERLPSKFFLNFVGFGRERSCNQNFQSPIWLETSSSLRIIYTIYWIEFSIELLSLSRILCSDVSMIMNKKVDKGKIQKHKLLGNQIRLHLIVLSVRILPIIKEFPTIILFAYFTELPNSRPSREASPAMMQRKNSRNSKFLDAIWDLWKDQESRGSRSTSELPNNLKAILITCQSKDWFELLSNSVYSMIFGWSMH